MAAIGVWLLLSGSLCSRLGRKAGAHHVISRNSLFGRTAHLPNNLSSARHVAHGGRAIANTTLSARGPRDYPTDPKAPAGCEDFTACLGGDTSWESRGRCCAKFAHKDLVVESTYCTVFHNGAYTDTLRSLCRAMRTYDTDDQYTPPLGITLAELTKACDAWCDGDVNEVFWGEFPSGWCKFRDLKKCVNAAGANLGQCCADYAVAAPLEDKCRVQGHDSWSLFYDCGSGIANPKQKECDAFCNSLDWKSPLFKWTAYWYGRDYYSICTIPKEVRNCYGNGGKLGKCCAQVPGARNAVTECSTGAGAGNPLSLGYKCHLPTGNPGAADCIEYCDTLGDLYQDTFCRSVAAYRKGCYVVGDDWRPSGKCCAAAQGTGSQFCDFSYTDDRGLTGTISLNELCAGLRDPDNPYVPCGLEITKNELITHCDDYCNNVVDWVKEWWCDPAANSSYYACLKGVEADEYKKWQVTPTPKPDPLYESLDDFIEGLGHEWATNAKCCGKNPTAAPCRSFIKGCEVVFDPKFEDLRDQISDAEYADTGKYGDVEAEALETIVNFCNKICSNLDDEPDWCGNVPANDLLPGEIAAIVLGCFLFLAIVGIVVLAILFVKKPGVGAAPSG